MKTEEKPIPRITPAEFGEQALQELENELRPLLENEYGGQDALGAIRRKRERLVGRLKTARWRVAPTGAALKDRE